MNILFLTLSKINNLNNSGLYTDLVNALKNKGHKVYIVRPIEKRESDIEEVIDFDNIKLLKIRTGNITKNKSFIEKGLSMLHIERQFRKGMEKYYKGIKFDLVIYATPPITFNNLIKWIKDRDNAHTYLMLKDIFPKNAVDMEIFSKKSPMYRYFKKRENELYTISDYIGTMSEANKNYIIKHNRVDPNKVEVFPNSISIEEKIHSGDRDKIYEQLGLNPELKTFIYGGNIGLPQDPNFIIEFCKRIQEINGWQILIIGSGSKYDLLYENVHKLKNVIITPSVENENYEKILSVCDIGLIFLSHKFTIPNYPSRILSYCKYSKPIIAMTDISTDVRSLIEENSMGLWFESNEESLDRIISAIKQWLESAEYQFAGSQSKKILVDKFNIKTNIGIIIDHFQKGEENV